jgi:phosphoglycerol transferase
VASVCSVLFTLLPFHFYRHESQVLLSAYYAVPLGAYLFLALFGDEPLLVRRDDGPRRLVWASRPTLTTLLLCVVIGSAGLYYAVFAILLLLAGTLVAAVARRGGRAVVAGLVASAAIGLTLTANLAPSLLYAARHGGNPRIARTVLESEQLGLRLSNLVLPVRGHRLPLLADVNAEYAAETSPRYCESCNETLGAVGAAGFVVLCLIALAACVGVAKAEPGRPAWHARYRPAALGVALAFAIGTTGGLSALVAFVITPDVRGWNRISLFIAFFSLLAAGLLLASAGRRLRAAGRRVLAGGLLVAVLVLGALDETSNFFVVDYAGSAREYHSDKAFGQAIQSRLPPGANVLELPYVPFPEGFHIPGQPPPSAFSTSYDLLRPYLNTRGLHWSFGAVKGRPGDWEGALATQRLDVAVGAAAAAGFQALYVDSRGYGTGAPGVLADLTRLLGARPLVSPRGDTWLFDLRPYLRRLRRRLAPGTLAAAGEATLHPLETSCRATPAELILSNPARGPRIATLSASLVAPLLGGATLLISFPDGSSERRVLGATPTTLHRRLVLAPGRGTVRFELLGLPPVGASAMNPAFVVSAPALTDAIYTPLRTRAGPGLPVAGLIGPSCSDFYMATAASRLPPASPPPPGVRRGGAAF